MRVDRLFSILTAVCFLFSDIRLYGGSVFFLSDHTNHGDAVAVDQKDAMKKSDYLIKKCERKRGRFNEEV